MKTDRKQSPSYCKSSHDSDVRSVIEQSCAVSHRAILASRESSNCGLGSVFPAPHSAFISGLGNMYEMQREMVDGGGEEESMKLFLSVGISLYEMIQHFIRKKVLYHIASSFYFYCVKLDFETPTILVTGVSMAPCARDQPQGFFSFTSLFFLVTLQRSPFYPV